MVAFCYHCEMSQPVKLSDELVLDVRLTSEVAERSIAGQIEYWAQLGRAIEPLLQGAQALALRRGGEAALGMPGIGKFAGRPAAGGRASGQPAVSPLRTGAGCSRDAGSH
jgi:hypothetical protein